VKLGTYVVAQGDTLGVLARQLLGDIMQVDALIQINKLRYPYISDNAADQLSRPKGNIYLTQQHINASSLIINNSNSVVILPGDTIFLLQGISFSSAVVQSSTATTITLQTPLSGTFDQAAIVTVYVNQQNVTSQVLKTGNVLLYPVSPATNLVNSSYSMLLGTDWQLDQNGYLLKSNGKIATVTGLNNLSQALMMRLRTPKGSLKLHPEYGNDIFNILGEAGNPYFRGLAKHYMEQCAAQDIRVRKATVTDFSISGDSISANLMIYPVGSQDPINQPIKIPIGGIN
jgi:LysM repeat protein/phage baseplate assembly protein W